MQKTAKPGERGILNKLREMTNLSGKAAETFFNPQFKAVMEEIREKDDQIRALVVGSRIGKADPGSDAIALKTLLKQAKSSLNRREYLTAVADLGKFHKKIKEVIDAINSIKNKVDEVHHDFLFKGLKDNHLEELQDLRKRLAAQQSEDMVKMAGVVDFLKNIGTSRGRALAAWEKRYPKEVGKIRDGANGILNKSQTMLDITISSLKEMAQARSVRNPDDYMRAASQIEKAYVPYENGKGGFKEFYNTTLKEWFEKMDRINERDAVATRSKSLDGNPTTKEIGDIDIPVHHDIPPLTMPPLPGGGGAAPPASEVFNVTPGATGTDPTSFPSPPGTPQPGTMVGLGPEGPAVAPIQTKMYGDLTPPSNRSTLMGVAPPASGSAPGVGAGPTPVVPSAMTPEQREEFRTKMEAQHGISSEGNHKAFYKSLEKLSKEDPLILAAYIAKYAKAIQSQDTETSLKLFKIVKNIRG